MSDKKRILLIDDDEDLVESTRYLLEANGYEVFTAHDGQTGIEVAREARPDLLLLDVMMGTRDEGFNVSRQVRDTPELKDTPVILLTGIQQAMKLPFGFAPDDAWLPVKAVLTKPIASERLLQEVAKHVR